MKYTQTITNHIPDRYQVSVDHNVLTYPVPIDEIHGVCAKLYGTDGVYLRTIFATDDRAGHGGFTIHYVFSIPADDCFLIPTVHLAEDVSFPSLTDIIYEAHFYEREMATFFGLKAANHINPQPIILHHNWPKHQHPLRKDFPWDKRPPMATDGLTYRFQMVEGEGIYEIPVGPVHAGIIEPGHFRFSVAGEEILTLEPMLGYVHKGTEKLFETLPLASTVALSEHVSGDSSVNHSLAYCQALESLSGLVVPPRALYLRTVFAELERIANHLGDIGFIMNDTGFSFGGSRGSKMRETVMQLNDEVTGSRYLRGVNTIGGVTKDLSSEVRQRVIAVLKAVSQDFTEMVEIVETNDSVTNRLHRAGTLSSTVASHHGVVGIAARAAGLAIDIRIDHPYAAYSRLSLKKATHIDSDVYARYRIRVQEVHSSIRLILQALDQLPAGPLKSAAPERLPASKIAVGMAEGWRGDIVYVVVTDAGGNLTRVSVRDPSFLNWPAVPYAVATNIVPDFPLINKSFNLSYSGYDR